MKRQLVSVAMFTFVVHAVLGAGIVAHACTGIPQLQYSTVTSQGGVLLACPAGDGPALEEIGAVITLVVRSMCPEWSGPLPVPGIPATDIWLWSEGMMLCGGSGSSNADGPTDVDGRTTISGAVASGGHAETINVVVTGILLGEIEVSVVSPDIDRDLVVGIGDLAEFAMAYSGSYDPRADMDGNGILNLQDVSLFADHWGHVC